MSAECHQLHLQVSGHPRAEDTADTVHWEPCHSDWTHTAGENRAESYETY